MAFLIPPDFLFPTDESVLAKIVKRGGDVAHRIVCRFLGQ
jgi:hypothetical protein